MSAVNTTISLRITFQASKAFGTSTHLNPWQGAACDEAQGWQAHRCILLLHVIFVFLSETGSQIALRRNHRGWEEMEASDNDPTLGRETAAQQMCPQKEIIYSQQNKTKLMMMKHFSWFLVYTFRHKQTWSVSHVCIDQVYLEVCLC